MQRVAAFSMCFNKLLAKKHTCRCIADIAKQIENVISTVMAKVHKKWMQTRHNLFSFKKINKANNCYYISFRSSTYMSSSFWLVEVDSRDFSHVEKERTARKAEQIHKLTTIFTQNGHRLSLWLKICSALQAVLSFSAWKKSRDSTHNSQKPEDM